MGIDANPILESPVDFGALLEPKPKHFSITLVGSSLHKKDILESHVPSNISVTMLKPKESPVEPNYINGELLIKKKANDLFAAIEKDGHVQGKEEVWVANDLNNAYGVTGFREWEPMRKFTNIDKNLRHEVQKQQLTEHINKNFSDWEDNTFYTVRIEALSGWRLSTGGLIIINERGYITLAPIIIQKLRDPEFVKNYLEYCETVQNSMREEGENPGARNLNAPWGIRWDDLLSLIQYEDPTPGEPAKGQGIHLNVRTIPSQSPREGFYQHIRGFSAVTVDDAIPIVKNFLQHPQKLKSGLFYKEFKP